MMRDHDKKENHFTKRKLVFRWLVGLSTLVILLIIAWAWFNTHQNGNSKLEATEVDVIDTTAVTNITIEGKDAESGLVAKGDFLLVKNTCTACHSSSLILQAKFSRQTWIEKIRWMQAKQKLWDLGSSEQPILDYLETFYGPDSVSMYFRKPPLKNIQWYKLED